MTKPLKPNLNPRIFWDDPECLRGLSWEEVKQKIRHSVNDYLK
jgi:hypothetical protein